MARPCFPNGIREFPFSHEDIRDIWRMAKDMRDQGMDLDGITRGLSEKLGLDPYHIAQALATNKTIPRTLTMEAWSKNAAYRRIVSGAKSAVSMHQEAVDHPVLRNLGRLYDIPRGLKTIGHWGVFTGTHGGDFAFMPSEWGRFLDQWQRGWRSVSSKYFDDAVQQNRAKIPLTDQYTAAGLDNNPYKHGLGIFSENSKIPEKFRAGQRGYGSLALARNVLMDDLWKRVQRIDPSAGKEQMRNLAVQVNHVWGSARLPKNTGPILSRLIFATRLLPARLLSTFVDIPKAAWTFSHWGSSDAAARVSALFQARRLVQVLAVHHSLVAANAAFNAMNGGAKVNLTDPSRASDWMAFKLGGLTIRPPSAILEVERLLAGIAYSSLAGGKKGPGDVLKDYATGKLNPTLGLITEAMTGTTANKERTPFEGLKERITGEPPLNQYGKPIKYQQTPGQYALDKTLPIPAGSAAREIYTIFKQEGLRSEEAGNWMRALSDPRLLGTAALETQGIPAHSDYKYKDQPPNKLERLINEKFPVFQNNNVIRNQLMQQ